MRIAILLALTLGGLVACQPPTPVHKPPPARQVGAPTAHIAAPPPVTRVSAPSAAVDAPPDPVPPAAQVIASAMPSQGPREGGYDAGIVRLEALLDRAGFSPGVIDGRDGANLRRAAAAFARASGVDAGPDLLDADLRALASADRRPVTQVYAITPADTAGPFIGPPPTNYEVMARLPRMAYSDPEQLLAEKFHMSRRLLEELNPKANFAAPGAPLLVAAPRPGPRNYVAAKVVVDKSLDQIRVFDPAGRLVALYPATVGSTERPAPSGVFAVRGVARNPIYFYDPRRLTFTPHGAKGKLRIALGPNNPVGTTWIALTIPTYGIHGSPDPSLIGKRTSHGCVRLTNWDAAELADGVKRGVEVDFVGRDGVPVPA